MEKTELKSTKSKLPNNNILVVGSVALDSVTTPFGTKREVLGGSATYSSIAASFFTDVNLVAVVGTDFPHRHTSLLTKHGIDIAGLEKKEGKTFRWTGVYSTNLNDRETKNVALNVFADFDPKIPEHYKNSSVVFLTNIDPNLKIKVLKQIKKAKLVACDTMNYWIEKYPAVLKKLLKNMDIFVLNDSEALQFSHASNLTKAAEYILKLGPKVVVIKKGEHGALCVSKDWLFFVPPYPLKAVKDPTGAGDSFAGGFFGYLSKHPKITRTVITHAMLYGTVMASYCIETFSVHGLCSICHTDIERRYKELRKMTSL